MRIAKYFLVLIILSCLSIPRVFSQTIAAQDLEFSKRTKDGRYNFLIFKKTSLKFDSSVSTVKKLLGLGRNHELVGVVTKGPKINSNGISGINTRFQQYFSGIKVAFAVLNVQSKNGRLSMVAGDYYPIPENFSVNPSLSEETALERALVLFGSSKFSWQQKGFPQVELNSRPRGELTICRDFMTTASTSLRLAYRFAIYATEPLRYDEVYVDASSGKILLINPIIKHVDGSANTRYSGLRTIATQQKSNSTYSLIDTTGNYNIATWNLNKTSNYSGATEFIDNDNNWTGVEFDNQNFDNAALDAHWGAMKTVDYFRTRHNRNSFDNSGARINSYVHYGTRYVNAFWNGFSMTYGDGDGQNSFPLTTLDISGHEIGHAVCQYSANLIYSYESGAINESLSDIWGACVEQFAAPEKNTWLLGNEIFTSGAGFRSMSNPKLYSQPDTYLGQNWYTGSGDNGGVHYNSGVMNYWFYLLSVGKAGTNDFGEPYNISSIGIEKAAAIVYRAETLYLFPNSGYTETRIATTQAAKDLYGDNSNEQLQVKLAWSAVGVREFLPSVQNFAASFTNNLVQLQWTYPANESIDGFSIERSIDDTVSFQTISFVNASVRSFTDSHFVNNSNNNYRIRAVRSDSVYSKYSPLVKLPIGNAPFLMEDGTITSCGLVFLDPGGNGNYFPNTTKSTTFLPAVPGTRLRVRFNQFKVDPSYAVLYVYGGPGLSDYMATLQGKKGPMTFESRSAGGEISFYFRSFIGDPTDSGWNAYISCFKPITAITGLTTTITPEGYAKLDWTDLVSDETSILIERSLNDSIGFLPFRELPANTTSFTDSSLPAKTPVYYRVQVLWDKTGSLYSNTAYAFSGTLVPMQNGTVTTCDALFVDNGGFGNTIYVYPSQQLVLKPSDPSKKIKVVFSEFQLSTYGDNLRVYDGPTTSSPLIGEYAGSQIPPDLESTAAGGELCFVSVGYGDFPGWKALISCFTPVATPGNLTTTNAGNFVQLNWADYANDETSYVVERAVNRNKTFQVIATLPANTIGFIDTSAIADALLIYRVRAFRNNQGSPYSNTSERAKGNAPFLMRDSTVVSCNKIFMDDGGLDLTDRGIVSKKVTFSPSTPGNRVRVTFSRFNLSNGYLYVYNGPNTQSPLIGYYTSTNKPPLMDGLGADGSLTFLYQSNGNSQPDSGWVAEVSCYKPVARPTNLTVSQNPSQRPRLAWTDNSDDETVFVIERSVNAKTLFVPIAEISANSTSFIDTTAANNSLLVYRVKARRDTLNSYYSDTASFNFGNAPFLMKDSTLIVCDKVFMDAGGVALYPPDNNTRIVTFKPAIPGNRIRVRFHQFRVGANFNVYNGSNTYPSPFLGSFYGNKIDSFFDGTNPDGSLTFLFQYSYSSDSGWLAHVSCYKPIPTPTTLTASLLPNKNVNLQWSDNSDDEQNFVIERSTNTFDRFVVIGTAGSNVTSFIDTLASDNSVLIYRIKAIRDTISSFYSNTSQVLVGNAPLIMKDTTAIACGKQFMDPGGVERYAGNQRTYTTTIIPPNPQYRVRVNFKEFKISYSSQLRVFNGTDTYSATPILFTGYSNEKPGTFEGLNPTGALTFIFSTSSEPDSGWVADVTCYKIVSKPTELKLTSAATEKPALQWKDNADDETSYVVERSTNSPSRYLRIATLPSNTTSYIDTSAAVNNLFYYRVKAMRDTLSSFYSDTTFRNFGNAPYLMADSTIYMCDRIFMDAGGTGMVPYFDYKTTTIKPTSPGYLVRVQIQNLHLRNGYLNIYDGPITAGLPKATLHGTWSNYSYQAQNPDGSLTFYHQYGNPIDSGWTAYITCVKSVAKPTNLKAIPHLANQVRLSWADSADDETKYIVERAVNNRFDYKKIAELPANSTSYIDTNFVLNSLILYRVQAIRDTMKSYYSDTAIFENGNVPIIMVDSIVIGCDKKFLDPGGDGLYPTNVQYSLVTFKPSVPGQKIRLSFDKFKLGQYVTLSIYDASSAYDYSKLIGNYTLNNMPADIVSTNSEGSLTVSFQNPYNNTDSGWVAFVSCIEGINGPSGIRALKTIENKVKLQWEDNTDNETAYVIERSMSDTSAFQLYAELPPDTRQYIDESPILVSNLRYRVMAKRGTTFSKYSEIASVSLISDTIVMKNGSFTGCGFTFMDPGGLDNYPNNSSVVTTFYPPDNQSRVKVTFRQFKMTYDYYDRLAIYNGNSTDMPSIANANGYNSIQTLTSSAPDGSLTFKFTSDYSMADSGWTATISCVRNPSPTNLTVKAGPNNTILLNWKKADTVTSYQYQVERSIGSPDQFVNTNAVPLSSDSSATDFTAPKNSIIYYRVKLQGYTNGSAYTNLAHIRTSSCTTMDSIATENSSQYFYNNGEMVYYDTTCKLIAKFIPINSVVALSKVSVRHLPAGINHNGQELVRRLYEVYISNGYEISGRVKLYYTQAEFDEYNLKTNHAKLPANPLDYEAFKNVRLYVLRFSSAGGTLLPGSYSADYPAQILDDKSTTLSWNSKYNCWELTAYDVSSGGMFLSTKNDTVKICSLMPETATNLFWSNVLTFNVAYQWQKLNGQNWTNLNDGLDFTGTKTQVLSAKNYQLGHGDQFRCIVGTKSSRVYTIDKTAVWTGAVSGDWNDSQNWKCGVRPHNNSAILIEAGRSYYPNITNHVYCRKLTVQTGAYVNLTSGFTINISKD